MPDCGLVGIFASTVHNDLFHGFQNPVYCLIVCVNLRDRVHEAYQFRAGRHPLSLVGHRV